MGKKDGTRAVALLLNSGKLEVRCIGGDLIRCIDLSGTSADNNEVRVFRITDEKHLVIKNETEYDLVLEFESPYLLNSFVDMLTGK